MKKEDIKVNENYWLIPSDLSGRAMYVKCVLLKNRLFKYKATNRDWDNYGDLNTIKDSLFLTSKEANRELCKRILAGEQHFMSLEDVNKLKQEFPECFL